MSRRSAALRTEDLEPLATFLGGDPPAAGVTWPVGVPNSTSGSTVPPCWQWCLLLDPVDPARLDDDGCPVGGPITPNPGMTRMFAGGRVVTKAPLELDVPTTRTTRTSSTADKQGRRGPLRFVTLESVWTQRGETRLIDEQDYVFTWNAPSSEGGADRHPGASPVALRESQGPARDPLAPGQIRVTEPMLVAFSGLTANPYRIHWDKAFCARAGHDGLVIHGPLQALWLAGEFARRGRSFTGRTFSYRFTATATAPGVMTLGEGDDGALAVRRPDGIVTTTATLD